MKRNLFIIVACVGVCVGVASWRFTPELKTSPAVIEANSGMILAESMGWLDSDYDVVAPPGVNEIETHVGKACCTRVELTKLGERHFKIHLLGRFVPTQEGQMEWFAEIAPKGGEIFTTVA